MKLAQRVEGFELDPSNDELNGISKELANSKVKVHAIAFPLMRSDELSTAIKTYELVQEAEEIASRGQRWIRQLLRRLAVNHEGSETSSARTPAATTQALRATWLMTAMKIFQEEDQWRRTWTARLSEAMDEQR